MTPHLKKQNNEKIKNGLVYGGIILLYGLITVNIAVSQKIPPLYFNVIEEDKAAIVSYLTQIKSLPIFQAELIKYKDLRGESIEKEVFKKDWKRRQQIASLEDALKKNPNSRDLLYGLSILFKEGGDKSTAEEYLKKAREVDPTVK